MVPFLIILGAILVVGPGHTEGGFEAIKEKGAKAALIQAWDERTDVPITQELYQEKYND